MAVLYHFWYLGRMLNLFIIALLITLLGSVIFLIWWLVTHSSQNAQKTELEAMVNQVFGLTSVKMGEQYHQVLRGEKEAIHLDLENRQQRFEQLVTTLKADLDQRQNEIRGLEQDRVRKFSELVTTLQQHRQQTDQLQVTTQNLASLLTNNQQRGEWGERIIEDVLRSNGLIEGVHYAKQLSHSETGLRPDITLLLPNKRNVPVDVKFPYAAMQKMALADNKAAKDVYMKQFASDVKSKIDKVAAYISPSANTLDYAILFVPNEAIFSFLNQQFPDLVDYAIGQRVIIVSPFTFLIVARTVIESYRNFMIGDRLKEVVKYVDEFVKEWSIFKQKFEKYGRSLDTLRTDYEELSGTRVRQMDRRIEKVDHLRQGSLPEIAEGA